MEFPEARILEEAMNVLLFEERNVCSRCGREKGRCSPVGISAQLQLPPITYSSHSASVSVNYFFLSVEFIQGIFLSFGAGKLFFSMANNI